MRQHCIKADRSLLLAVLLLFALLGLVVLSVFNTSAFPIDDAFISFRYARNLIEGFGLVFNHGEKVEAYSNFLWLILVSALSACGLSEILAARLLGLASLTAVCVLLFLQFRRTRTLILPLAVSIGFMLLPATIFHAMSGMETLLSVFLVLAAGTALESEIDPRKKAFLAGLGLAAFSLNRPEGLLLFACVLAGIIIVWLLHSRSSYLQMGTSFLVSYACVVVAFVVWRFFYYGALIPNSMVAKSGFLHPMVLKAGIKYLGLFLGWHAPLVFLAAVSFFFTERRRWLQFRIPVAGALLVTALLGGVGDGYPYSRYLYPLFACLVVWAVEAGVGISQSNGLIRSRAARGGLLILLLGAQVILLIKEHSRAPLIATEITPLRRPIAFFQTTPDAANPRLLQTKGLGHYQAGRWLREHASPNDLLATFEIGIVPYISRLPILDLYGLADRHIARNRGLPGRRADLPYVWSRKPAYLMLRAPSDCLCSDYQLFFDRRFKDGYDLVATFPYWTTDILLFKRRAGLAENVVFNFRIQAADRVEGPIEAFERVQLLAPGQKGKLQVDVREAGAAHAMREWIATWRAGFALAGSHEPPSGTVTFELPVPQGAALRFGVGVTASQESRRGGRARVEILARDGQETETVFQREFNQETAGWEDHAVDLSRFADRRVRFSFRIENEGLPLTVGFGDPRIVVGSGAHLQMGGPRVPSGDGTHQHGPTIL